jgi:signal recognition particle protein
MLDFLTGKFQGIFSRIAGKNRISEKNISESVDDVRKALLDADVNFQVVKALVDNIREEAMGKKVLRSVTPGQQFIKVVHDELVAFMGGNEAPLLLNKNPSVVMVCGLQGSGKTTFSAKLALYLRKQKKCTKPLLVACDLQRPAAVEQLKTLGGQASIDVFSIDLEKDPLKVAKEAITFAKQNGHDVIIVDTAGRLHLDEELMEQLKKLKELVTPDETLFVANAMLGQDAVNTAKAFHQRVSITGTVLTMLDGNTKGGAALSIKHVTGKPLKFEGVGEKIEDLQVFNPRSMADRILGMGDTLNLVRKAQEHMEESDMEDMEEKIKKASFTYSDLLKQFGMIKKMGSLKGLLGMLPGLGGLNLDMLDESKFYKIEAMILSMAKKERNGMVEIDIPRRKRIAKGSGTELDDVNRLVKMYSQAKEFFKNGPDLKKMQKMMGGMKLWR